METKSMIVNSVLSRSTSSPIIVECSRGTGNLDGSVAVVRQDNRSLVVTKQKGRYYSGLTERDVDTVCHKYLVVQCPDKRIVLVPTEQCKVTDVHKQIETAESSGVIDKSAASKRLAEEFGSKRMKRQLLLKDKLSIHGSTVNEESVAAAAEGVEVNEEELNHIDDLEFNIFEMLPSCDRNASTALLVYPLDLLISPIERRSLQATANFMIENPPTDIDEKVSFFMSHHYKMIGRKKMTVEKMTLMLYIDSIFNFLCSRKKVFTKKEEFCPYSQLINTKIFHEFTEGKIRTMKMENKAICYTMILILHLCDMKIYLRDITTCFKGYDINRLKMLLRCIGVKTSRKNSGIYSLSIPLPPLPKPKHNRVSRR